MQLKHQGILLLLLIVQFPVAAQDTMTGPRPLTMEEYEKTKTFDIKDLDKDSYLKIENTYILDRYEMRKPYFITGDDGLKKRIDLYKLFAREGMQELGLMIFYTNEKGQRYKACMPNFTADGKVWEKYFDDIHAIDKTEKNFVLKLSYVLSREMGFQLYKALHQGQDLTAESVTYGNDICFPGDQVVTLAGGMQKELKDIIKGDRVVTVDPATGGQKITTVEELVEHAPDNYAITRLTVLSAKEATTARGMEVTLSVKTLEATPNHPVATAGGTSSIGAVKEGDRLLCYSPGAGTYNLYGVISREEIMEGKQKVYNIITREGETFIMNDMIVMQK